MKYVFNSIGLAIALFLIYGCAGRHDASGIFNHPPKSPSQKIDQSVRNRLLKIAGEYKTYGLADDRLNWAPIPCDMPPRANSLTPRIRFSESRNTRTHGRKLYYLHARYPRAYNVVALAPSPVGQVVVKEAFASVEFKLDAKDTRDVIRNSRIKLVSPTDKPLGKAHIQAIAQRDGKAYRAGDKTGLFIMYKAGPEVPAASTDQGWLYGTVSADGKTVTSAGRVANCMKCHADAPRDRLFGLAKSGSGSPEHAGFNLSLPFISP